MFFERVGVSRDALYGQPFGSAQNSASRFAFRIGSRFWLEWLLLGVMKNWGFQYNVIEYNASISTREKGLQRKKALPLLGEMKLGVQYNAIEYTASISTREKGLWRQKVLPLG